MNSERLQILLEQLGEEGNDPFILYGIAMEYLSQNEFETAAQYLVKNVEEFPDYLPSYYQLATVLDEMDQLDQAMSILRIGLKLAEETKEEKTARELQQYLTNLEME